jgi:hypothetical protein
MRKPTAKQVKLARGHILEGKSFRASALEAGYSESTANKGPAIYAQGRPGLQSAFITAAQQADLDANMMQTVSKHRLFSAIVAGKACENTKDIEVLGRFKSNDWFVRNTDVQIGVFASLADDTKVAASVESLTVDLPKDEE